jgi:uncharacterized membrane protein
MALAIQGDARRRLARASFGFANQKKSLGSRKIAGKMSQIGSEVKPMRGAVVAARMRWDCRSFPGMVCDKAKDRHRRIVLDKQEFPPLYRRKINKLSALAVSAGRRGRRIMEGLMFILRWIHFLAGVTWIGLLYYFNFVQTPFFAETEAPVRSGAIQKLVPRALWWFRWGAMFTFLAGILIYGIRMHEMGAGLFYSSPYGVTITVGGLMGTLMFLNVWLVIWPKQQIVIASTNQVASGGQALPEAAGAARRAALTSRTNTVFSIPMLFYMGAASHYPAMVGQSGSRAVYWILVFIVIGAVQINALMGTQGVTKKPLDSVSGALWAGFVLTAALYVLTLALT